MSTSAEVLQKVESAFASVAKPEHFTNHLHCEECEEHDSTLRGNDRSTLSLEHVGNPGWDPICHCSPLGKAYYLPSLVRLALQPHSSYWQQLLFHLEGNGSGNELILFCSEIQREAVASFLEHLLASRTKEIEQCNCVDELLRTHGYWAAAA